jgi:hypothetical protein
VSRWTRTGYEAWPIKASRHVAAKLLWSRRGCVDPAVVRGRIAFLPGEISRMPERVTTVRSEREVSSGHSSWATSEGPNEKES